jgi:hypothetical protein
VTEEIEATGASSTPIAKPLGVPPMVRSYPCVRSYRRQAGKARTGISDPRAKPVIVSARHVMPHSGLKSHRRDHSDQWLALPSCIRGG